MAKHISQYFLLGILFIALVLTSGSTPGLFFCSSPSFCDSPPNCDARCRTAGYQSGVCTDIPGNSCCCV
ncbi:hypothetical protein MtrunA17_Chr3g0098001 [Medicago truncatula]|uniref:LCR-like protein n=1 Tax=Medicago truncatula TaxID=3880 RepID=A0A072UW37_MEDTR|nr:LCR-like protein [Medicago truncatula]RHN67008.1 hypothetical protein MtrunA17_Chr3g0098001 [Medicago truncatula]